MDRYRIARLIFWFGIVVILWFLVVSLTSCGPTPQPITVQFHPTPVSVQQQAVEYTAEDLQSRDLRLRHEYNWASESLQNFQLTCPSKILMRDGEDFCVVVKCDSVGVAISCNW